MLPYAKLARLLMPIQELPLGAQLIFSGKETAMTPGTIIELEVDGPKNKWTAKVGARATAVDGKKKFPELYDQLEEYLRNFGELDKDMKEFIFVAWDRNDPRWNKQSDGAYTKYRFREVGKGPEPKNNDGRTICFWCNGPTEIRQGFTSSYNICPKCKR